MITTTPHRSTRGVLERTFTVPLVDLELREPNATNNMSDWFTIQGHAAVFDTPTELMVDRNRGFRITEEISRDAFTNVLARNPDVHLNINHDMSRVMARTNVRGVGGLELRIDNVGLGMYARVSPKLSYMQDLAELMRAGVVDQASFAFMIGNEEMTTTRDADGFETDHFRILEVADLRDVCVAPRGAYETTDAVLHARIRATGRAIQLAGPNRASDPDQPGGVEPRSVSDPDKPGGAESLAAERRLAALRLRARVALTPYRETIQ